MASIENEISTALKTLAQPLSPDEIAGGWTPEAKAAMHKLLTELKEKIQAGQSLPQLSLSRALDHWGVSDGALLEQMAHLSNELRRHSSL
jgi:hypothetical protein